MFFNLEPFPTSTTTLVWYCQYLSKKLKSHASLVAYLAGVKTLHELLNFSTKGFLGFFIEVNIERTVMNESTHS